MNKLKLILGDQLNINHSWFKENNSKITYVMMEVKEETSYVLHHAQKIIATFAAMRFFAEQLQQKGFEVIYFKINDKQNKQSFYQNINKTIKEKNIGELQYLEPDEYRLSTELKKLESIENIKVESVDTEHFLVPKLYAKDFFSEKKHWRMEEFYRNMRKKFSILMEEDKPIGGKWNFDSDNRKRWNGSPNTTEDFRPSHNHEKLFLEINNENIEHFGEGQETSFHWPISREESITLLNNFIAKDLVNFGDFQDALHDENWRLFHSFLSFSLNSKMLSPLEVIKKAEEAYYEKDLPLASVEGFIRQILGWREYIRGVYWANMPGYDQHNFFKHNAKLPDWYWTGKTDMRCLALSISQSLANAYAHHIQRLMVTGNFALLAQVHPDEVDRWYLGVYADAVGVQLPNTRGMSQWADGGIVATKPYVSAAAYIHKMSNYCEGCKYDKKKRVGDDACPFNSLYWNFLDDKKQYFAKNNRMAMMLRLLEKIPPTELADLKERAYKIISNPDEY